MNPTTIILAGATGNLGQRTLRALVERGARVRALVRSGTPAEKTASLQAIGCNTVEVDFHNLAQLTEACAGGSCVVSTVAGLRDVIIDTQGRLLDAAVAAGVRRFIPSDYSIDFTKLPAGSNRNLDLRREFHVRLQQAPIAVTSIFNGAFTDMLTGQAPFILFDRKRTLCWGDPDQLMDFTTVDDTAAFTAAAALDDTAPRALCHRGRSSERPQPGRPHDRRHRDAVSRLSSGASGSSAWSSASPGPSCRRRTTSIRPGRACSTCATCSAVWRCTTPSTTIGIREWVGPPPGPCGPPNSNTWRLAKCLINRNYSTTSWSNSSLWRCAKDLNNQHYSTTSWSNSGPNSHDYSITWRDAK